MDGTSPPKPKKEMPFKALRNYGAPEAIVTDNGGVFYSKRAMAIYEALGIRKERKELLSFQVQLP